MFNRKPSSLVGLDISSSSIKLLELSKHGDKYRIESFAVQAIPRDIIVEKNINNPESLAEEISKIVQASQSKAKAAAIAVPDSSVITKVLQMDADMSDQEIENQLSFEADKYIPYPLEEVSLDFTILGENLKKPELVDVLLVASRSENVNLRAEILAQAGLTPKVVDVESYAIERACGLIFDQTLGQTLDQTENQIVAVFDIGATVTNLTVLSNRTCIFTREEGFGGDELIQNMAKRYQITPQQALGYLQEGNYPEDFNKLLQPFKESVVLQIRRALQFFFSASHHSEIHHIVLAGGNARLPGLVDLLQDQMGVITSIANPFQNMSHVRKVSSQLLDSYAPSMLLCCGLAMRLA